MRVGFLKQGWSGRAGVQFYADSSLTPILATSFSQETSANRLESQAMWGLMDVSASPQSVSDLGRYGTPFLHDVSERNISFGCTASFVLLERFIHHVVNHRHRPVMVVFEDGDGTDKTTMIFSEVYLKGGTISSDNGSLVSLSLEFLISNGDVWSFVDANKGMIDDVPKFVIPYYSLCMTNGELGWSLSFRQEISPQSYCSGSTSSSISYPKDLLFGIPSVSIKTKSLIRSGDFGSRFISGGTQANSIGNTMTCMYNNNRFFNCTGCYSSSDSASLIGDKYYLRSREWDVYGRIELIELI